MVGAHPEERQALERGRICALAVRGQRELAAYAATLPGLFPTGPFDPALFGAVAQAIAFGDPDCPPDRLRFANRCVLWGFAVDWQVDYVAATRNEIDALRARSLAVADGAEPEPGDDLSRLLADLRDELAAVPTFPAARASWRAELRKVLDAMGREWDWRAAAGGPVTGDPPVSLADYLANADNLACTIVNVSHWIRGGDAALVPQLPELVEASGAVQRALRLINDLATYERDLRWGDLNAIALVEDRSVVERVLAELVTECRVRLSKLRVTRPAEADYLSRQLGFSGGFYRLSDFWGEG
ncbi:terpene synthase family protein [Plantactinospora sp. GCM10030261]|uniref:terpene synthase family protein n=1 Tax=Plantactinospora sp. GCM10030261 TaxID=3273420 RepID=UPI00360A629A